MSFKEIYEQELIMDTFETIVENEILNYGDYLKEAAYYDDIEYYYQIIEAIIDTIEEKYDCVLSENEIQYIEESRLDLFDFLGFGRRAGVRRNSTEALISDERASRLMDALNTNEFRQAYRRTGGDRYRQEMLLRERGLIAPDVSLVNRNQMRQILSRLDNATSTDIVPPVDPAAARAEEIAARAARRAELVNPRRVRELKLRAERAESQLGKAGRDLDDVKGRLSKAEDDLTETRGRLTKEEKRSRRNRNIALGVGAAGLVGVPSAIAIDRYNNRSLYDRAKDRVEDTIDKIRN